MPHIHTAPGQHDITVSAYIIRIDQGEPRLLVHMHKKIGKLMQIGGHIELDETPWQALAHEVREESGYSLDELRVLQPTATSFTVDNAVVHPVPLLANTHRVSDTHYHSDFVYGLIASNLPVALPHEEESSDLRWLSAQELQQEAANGIALQDVADIFSAIASTYLDTYHPIEASRFSLEKPTAAPV